MTYLPTQDDLALLTNRSKDILCRIELLDKDYSVVECIDGLALSGSGSIDADSDTRRTFNLTLHPKSSSIASDYDVEDWVNKMVRVYIGMKSPAMTPFYSMDASDNAIDRKIRTSDEYIEAVEYYNRTVAKIKATGYGSYGNIDNINRNRIWWTVENTAKYGDFVNENPDIKQGTFSTVVAKAKNFDGFTIAYTTLLASSDGATPVLDSVVDDYINQLITVAKETVGEITPAAILQLDSIGIEMGVYGQVVLMHGMIAAINGQIFNNAALSSADVCAIAGWTEQDLLDEYGEFSRFVGNSLHDIHHKVWDAKDGMTETYKFMWMQITGSPIGDRSISSVSGLSSGYIDTAGTHWYSQGVFAIKNNGFTYDATTNTMSLSCTDLTALLDGTLGGSLVGFATKIYKYGRKLDDDGYAVEDTDSPVLIRDAIYETFKLSGMSKHMIDYWKRYVPHDMEYGTGVTVWEILSELRDLYQPFEMYFDEDTFVCKEIPSGIGDPVVLDPDLFAGLVISENASIDYTQIYNCVEVWGATIESDAYCKNVIEEDNPTGTGYVIFAAKTDTTVWNDTIKLMKECGLSTSNVGDYILLFKMKNIEISDGTKISFICPSDLAEKDLTVVVYDEIVIQQVNENGDTVENVEKIAYGPMRVYSSMTDKNGDDVLQDLSALKKDKYYVIQYGEVIINKEEDETLYSNKESRVYFLGQSQSHAMVKFVDIMPSDSEIEADKISENCDNLKYIVVNDPTDLTGLYNSRFTIDQIGRRNKVLSGGEYDNYTTDESAMEVAEYMLWKGCRLVDTLTLTMIMVPWLNVNEKIKYAAKYLKSNIPVEWMIKKIDTNLGEGTMNMTLSRYYPYYPYIVSDKYE